MHHIKLFEDFYTDQWGKLIVWENNYFKIAVSDLINPTRISLWNDKNIGNLYLSTGKYELVGKKYFKVSSIEIDKKFRGLGLSTELYKIALEYINADGIISYLPDRINKKQIPNIYKRLGGEIIGDFAIINKK